MREDLFKLRRRGNGRRKRSDNSGFKGSNFNEEGFNRTYELVVTFASGRKLGDLLRYYNRGNSFISVSYERKVTVIKKRGLI